MTMKPDKLLLSLIDKAKNKKTYAKIINPTDLVNIELLAEKCFTQKGVYTVFITLAIYKIIHPEQDIRKHQSQISGGFSGRTIDTQYITPILKETNLPSMAESGWLTRSLEQPHPYNLNYEGKISNKKVKKSFLELLHAIEIESANPSHILVELLRRIILIQEKNKVTITKLRNPEKLSIARLVDALSCHFSFNYKTHGGSKLPVIAFYSIYQIIINEVNRYKDCSLKEMGSHTTSDRTSKSAGDIEVFKNVKLFEAVEIKLDKEINANIIRIAREKIIRYNPKRYYILSNAGVDGNNIDTLNSIINAVKNEHGCQIIINGILPTLKYYLRLISDLNKFLVIYSTAIEKDLEIKTIHKQKWAELVLELQNEL